MRNVKKERWMRQPTDDEESSALVLYRPGISGKNWVSSPEATMVETGALKDALLKRIRHEIGSLLRWRLAWDNQMKPERKEYPWIIQSGEKTGNAEK